MSGVIVLTSSVSVCPSVCYHSNNQTDRHKDLDFGMRSNGRISKSSL